MREILFRGKRIMNDEWIEGYFSKYSYERGQGDFICDADFDYTVYPESIGQFTGLTDKNGKRIFEGDIVTGLFLFERSIKAVVTFQDGAFGLEWYRGGIKTFNAFTSVCNVEYEVIGNIHDRPELLKGD